MDKEESHSPKKNKFQLHRLRERLKRKKKDKLYFAPTGLELFSTLIQQQNCELLNKIADDKGMCQDDIDTMFRLFWNPSYWIPNITVNKHKECK